MLQEIINDLMRYKNNEQKFYECEGKTEQDKLLNQATQLTWEMAIDIVKRYLDECDHKWKYIRAEDDVNLRIKVYCPKCSTTRVMLRTDWEDYKKIKDIKILYNIQNKKE